MADVQLPVLPAADAEEEAEDVRLLALVELGNVPMWLRVSECGGCTTLGATCLYAPISIWMRYNGGTRGLISFPSENVDKAMCRRVGRTAIVWCRVQKLWPSIWVVSAAAYRGLASKRIRRRGQALWQSCALDFASEHALRSVESSESTTKCRAISSEEDQSI